MSRDDHHGSSKSSFSSMWQRGKEKVGMVSGKDVRFVSNLIPGEGGANDIVEQGGSEVDNLTPKQRRRAQVRKAQIEHRQRKENYVKHLEQDIIDLREIIAKATNETLIFKRENGAIREVISKAELVHTLPPSITAPHLPPQPPHASQYDDPLNFPSIDQDYQIRLASQSELQPYLGMWDTNQFSSSLVSTCFDEFIDASCLQISPVFGQDILLSDGLENSKDHIMSASSLNAPSVPSLSARKLNATEIELSTLAINFILALEHPCRTHFQAPASAFAPNGSPSGHELMASTLLYSSAPDTVFSSPYFKDPTTSPTSASIQNHTHTHDLSWKISSSADTSTTALSLQNLQAMASSLPKNDWELTPVQAWFLLSSHYPAHVLLASPDGGQVSVLDKLKSGLGKIVKCFAFGAVMDEARFWDLVRYELGTGSGESALEI